MQRDSFRCRDCSNTEKTLSVHHCFYEPKSPPWDTEDKYLLTLCDDCHKERGSLEADAKRALAVITSNLNPIDLLAFVETLVMTTGADFTIQSRVIVRAQQWEPPT